METQYMSAKNIRKIDALYNLQCSHLLEEQAQSPGYKSSILYRKQVALCIKAIILNYEWSI